MTYIKHLISVHALSHVQLLVTPWTVACQLPLSIEFLGKNTGVGCHFLLQGIFLTQELNLDLCVSCIGRQILYQLCHLGSLKKSNKIVL